MNRHSNPGYFVPFNVMPYSTEKCHHWAIVTSLNPYTPTPLRPDDVIFLFLVLHPNTLTPDDVIFLFIDYAPAPYAPMMSSFLMTSQ